MLTDSEYKFLRRNGRRFKMTRDEALSAFENAGLPTLDVFLDFQTRFGGYRPDEDFTCGIVGLKDRSGEPRLSQRRNMQVVRCDLENISQIRMTIDENAVYYHDDTPVAESFESYIAFSAYSAQVLAPLRWTYVEDQRLRTKRFQEFLQKLETAPLISRVSDQYHWVRHNHLYFEAVFGNYTQLYIRQDLLKGW